jgi:hypothetical protein
MAAGIRHGVHDYEAMELSYRSSQNSFGVLFNEATRPTEEKEKRVYFAAQEA